MKGRKFEAAEKHFSGLEVKYKQEISERGIENFKLKATNRQLIEDNAGLQKEFAELKIKYDKLLEYSILSEDDIIIAVDKDKRIKNMKDFFDGLRYARML